MILLRRAGALAVLILICAVWVGAVLHPRGIQRLAASDDVVAVDAAPAVHRGDPPRPATLPWRGEVPDWVRRLAGATGSRASDPGLDRRPLDAPIWFNQAETLAAAGDVTGALRHLEIARALWPERPILQQRAVWMQVALGPPDLALAALMDYWRIAPADGFRTLALARRLVDTPEALVEAAARVWSAAPDEEAERYPQALMDLARRAGDRPLAEALWARLDPEPRRSEALLFPYLQLLVAQGRYSEADAIWQDSLGDPPGLVNGRFDQPLVPLGPNVRPGWATPGWRYQADAPGVRIRADRLPEGDGDPCLRIDFPGTHNLDLAQPSQIMRVRPGRRYRLQGYWSGEGITTRSGVFVELYTTERKPIQRVQTSPRRGTWAREPFSLEIQVPDDALLLTVRLRRLPTKALDRNLGGILRLDRWELRPLP